MNVRKIAFVTLFSLLWLFVFLIAIAMITHAHAQTTDAVSVPSARQVCSNAATAAPVTQVNTTQYQVDIKTTGTLTDGPCNPTPPPGCAVPPKVPAPNGKVYQRMTSKVTGYYFGWGTKSVDPTQFSSIFTKPGLPDEPWPSKAPAGNVAVVLVIPQLDYVTAEFSVPSDYASTHSGQYFLQSSSFTAAVSMTISTACGDFGQLTPTTIVPGCDMHNGVSGHSMPWSMAGSACELKAGQKYYLNIINADIASFPAKSNATNTCTYGLDGSKPNTGSNCTASIQNGPGSM